MYLIRKATPTDCHIVGFLANQLWPHHNETELESEFSFLLTRPDAVIFIAFKEDSPAGFAQCQLRHDYVEGTVSSPVGYLEGIFVIPAYRKTGIARALVAACEGWAKEHGCAEFASDCELANEESLRFHLNVGFYEANRIICFTKKL